MRVNGLTSSLCFGAVVAIAFVFVQHLAAPLLGSGKVLVFYLAACTVAYAGLLGSTPRRAIRNVATACVGVTIVVMMVVMLPGGMAGLAIGLAGVLALVRSGLEYSMKPARGLAIETLLGGLALGFASWVASPGWLGEAAGLWAFALVQSLYFLVPDRGRKSVAVAGGFGGIGIGMVDPFERAREQLLGLLEEEEKKAEV